MEVERKIDNNEVNTVEFGHKKLDACHIPKILSTKKKDVARSQRRSLLHERMSLLFKLQPKMFQNVRNFVDTPLKFQPRKFSSS
ncbi:hypothetical protein Syun_018371 [Stephania yunnanensis]|uniref:Uncharacterized protein n=1 Tax=Stephania yunnanensis TaxID=152371 RepID=A0AAP0IS88_9MAGN